MLTLDLHEYFVDIEGVTVASVLSLQSSGIFGPEFNTPETDRFVTDGNAAFSEQILYISMTEIETIVEPDCVADDVRWESVALVDIHLLKYQLAPVKLPIPGFLPVPKLVLGRSKRSFAVAHFCSQAV